MHIRLRAIILLSVLIAALVLCALLTKRSKRTIAKDVALLLIALLPPIIGNLIPVPFIIIFIRKIFDWMERISPKLGRLVAGLRSRADKKKDVVQKYAFWGLVILVAIPLPGTGAWTGALVAAMLNMRLKKAFPAIALGVAIAGVIVACVTYGVVGLLFG